MKKALLIILLPFLVIAATYTRVAVDFPDTVMVGTDTLWSYPVAIERTTTTSVLNALSFKLWAYSNDTCTMTAFFKLGDTSDTLLMDSLFYSPSSEPSDSTIDGFGTWVVPTDARVRGGSIYADVSGYLRVGLYMVGEATDSVWIGPLRQLPSVKWRYLRIDYIGGN